MIGMKTMSILGKSGACFSPKQGMLGSNLLWLEKKLNKEKLKIKCKTLQAKHITHEEIKI